jgi:hypothetical protein
MKCIEIGCVSNCWIMRYDSVLDRDLSLSVLGSDHYILPYYKRREKITRQDKMKRII